MTGVDTAELPALAIRGAALFFPLLPLIALCLLRPPGRRETAAMIVATAWSLLALVPLNLVALHIGWWDFHAEGAVWQGIPVDLLLAWAVLWGALPALALRYLPVPLLVVVLVWFDTLFMPLAEPVVVLGPWWVLGELAGTAVGLIPALLLAHWTLRGTLVHTRMWAQAFLALGFMVVLPVAVAAPEVAGLSGPVLSAAVQALALASLPGLAAAREFAAVGNGTPLPYDPPARLVTSGPYAYVRNPMQATVVCVYLVLGVLHPVLLLGAVVALACAAGFAAWHEGAQLRAAFGERWEHYRRGVRPWVPRWRPWPDRAEGALYVAAECSVCREVRAWVEARRPVRLRVSPAADHPEVLFRLTYEDTLGNRWSGVRALARALEHVNLGWALVGWALSLPLVRHGVQLCTDAFGGGPRASRPETVAR
ncbi:methyltransferase family protein [Nocardiopsis salina]|uniref:methyltransferase family protein n=1 Tax=Nocardiopsis salina TaxID=245836 RepID=UPI00036FF248|nr:methyltransferase [Nocardiopsis salina]